MASRRQEVSAILWHYKAKCRPGKPKIKELLAVLGKFGVEADKYGLRQQTVEPVFGIIKEVMGFRRFLLRGLEKVEGEWELVCLAYNCKRLHRMMQMA